MQAVEVTQDTERAPMIENRTPRNFPVVCVGGSAGGLDAYTRLLRNLPADPGAAIVIVNHRRKFATYLHQILPKLTAMPVELIGEGAFRMVSVDDHKLQVYRAGSSLKQCARTVASSERQTSRRGFELLGCE